MITEAHHLSDEDLLDTAETRFIQSETAEQGMIQYVTLRVWDYAGFFYYAKVTRCSLIFKKK